MFSKKSLIWLASATGILVALFGCVSRTQQPGNSDGTSTEGQEAVAEIEEGPVGPPGLSFGEDVTDLVRTQNSAEFAPPSTTFRAGHTTPRELASSAIQKDDEGFRIQLPSGAPVTTPTVHRDLVIVSGGFRSREMYAFRARDGDLAWAINLDDDGPSNPACDGDICVFNTESCTIFAVQASTGEMLWSWWLGDPLMSAPTIANGLVFTAFPANAAGEAGDDRSRPEGVSHALAAFDLESGQLRWVKWIDAEVISAPVAIDDALYAATFGGTLYMFDQETGEIRAASRSRATSAPAYIDGALYFTHRSENEDEQPPTGQTTATNASPPGPNPPPPAEARENAFESMVRCEKDDKGGGRQRATKSQPRRARHLEHSFQKTTSYSTDQSSNDAANGFSGGAPAASNANIALDLVGRNSVYGLQEYQGSWILGLSIGNFSVMGDALVSVDRVSGEERWSVQLPGNLAELGGALAPPPASAGGRIVVATLTGEILVVDPDSGDVGRRIPIGGSVRSQPVIDQGWIYVGTTNGQVVGINTGDPTLTGWPTWAGNAARTGVGQVEE